MKEARKLNKCAPERFMEHDRGYDVITNKHFGNGAKEQVHYADGYPKPRKTPWEEIEHGHAINGRSVSTPSLPSMAAAEQRSGQAVSSSAPARVNSGAVSQRSVNTQRSQTLSEAGAAQLREPPGATRAIPSGRALSASGSVTSAAQFQEPPGATRPIPRASSTPNLAPSPLAPAMARTPSEYSGAAVRTRRLSPRMPPPAPLGGSLTMKMSLPPPAPRIPGSPVGSVYSRPSAKA